MKKRSLSIFLAALCLVGAGAYAAWRTWDRGADAPKYKLANSYFKPLTATVFATGTMNPVV